MVVDAEAINYITTIKGERNRIVFHQKNQLSALKLR